MTRFEGLPHWPRRMPASLAAAYLGIEETKFRRKVRAGEYPSPRHDDGSVLWDKNVLDAWVDAWSGTDSKKVRQLESF